MLADFGVRGNGVDERGGKVFRVWRGKPYSIDARWFCHGTMQLGKVPSFMAVN